MNINVCCKSNSSIFDSLKSRQRKNVTKPPFIFELVQIQTIFGATTVGTKLNLEYFNIGTQGTLKTAKFN